MSDCQRCERLERALLAAKAYISALECVEGSCYADPDSRLECEYIAARNAALAAEPEPPCEVCGGSGSVCEMGHDCGGDERACSRRCPIPVQAPCPKCGVKP